MPLTRVFKLLGFMLPPVALGYALNGGDGRVELALLGLGAAIFYVAHTIEKKRSGG